jgi:hypothetical protein
MGVLAVSADEIKKEKKETVYSSFLDALASTRFSIIFLSQPKTETYIVSARFARSCS